MKNVCVCDVLFYKNMIRELLDKKNITKRIREVTINTLLANAKT